jgi:hypothetical protein
MAVTTILPAGTVLAASGHTVDVVPDNDTTSVTVTITVTAVSGTTPSLTVTVQPATPPPSHQGEDEPVAAFDAGVSSAAITTPGTYTVTLTPAPYGGGLWPRYYRVSYAITGTTPSFTLGITADH